MATTARPSTCTLVDGSLLTAGFAAAAFAALRGPAIPVQQPLEPVAARKLVRQLPTDLITVTKESAMHSRFNYHLGNNSGIQALRDLETHLHACGLEPALLELVKMRASQINGCAFCLDMHSKDARAAGESEQRLYVLDAWREAPLYTDRERAALDWTESLTNVADTHVPDSVYEHARRFFDEQELVNLTLAVVAINGWNRLAISSRAVAGKYQPKAPG